MDELRDFICEDGVDALALEDLTHADLDHLGWSGAPSHIRSVGKLLDRVSTGEVDYLAIRAPDGTPIRKGCVDYMQHADAGTMEQLATHDAVQGCGMSSRTTAPCRDRKRRSRCCGRPCEARAILCRQARGGAVTDRQPRSKRRAFIMSVVASVAAFVAAAVNAFGGNGGPALLWVVAGLLFAASAYRWKRRLRQ